MDSIYEMELHEIIDMGEVEIIRVTGGWVYRAFHDNGFGGYGSSSCFVPFNNEYQNKGQIND